ncbi:DUF7144 family membrane protein [Spirillospora sp. CA-142024]|uniref:DUF7144 family membrane protein n=1 Tax=Spirillospora sp. CA-142024 TaxID=3240036 RepID=UPI003D8D8223
MSQQTSARRHSEVQTQHAGVWATGLAVFAGVLMLMIGSFQALQGVAAIVKDQFYVVTPRYVYDFDVTAWGWTHLVLGILVALAGLFIFTGHVWARAVGIAFAAANAISQFLFLPYYPVWSVVMIALDVAVIWALCVYGRRAAEQTGYTRR